MQLSIIIATINDQDETLRTIQSIRETAGDAPEIVLVDDCSGNPLAGDWRFQNIPNLKLVSNKWRVGCGGSRHIGVLNCSGDWVLITDSHMRFTPGWLSAAKERLTPDRKQTLYCSTCLGLDVNHTDVSNPVGEYNGATFNFHGPDRQRANLTQTLECVWLRKDEWPADDAETPAIMGAGYFCSKDWFLHIEACRNLRIWGGDELMLSMKTWMAGGSVRMLRTVRIGHLFPLAGAFKMFNLPLGVVQFNKLLAAYSLFPAPSAERLANWILTPQGKNEIRDVESAKHRMRDDWATIAIERARNQSLFVHDAQWLCDKFHLSLP